MSSRRKEIQRRRAIAVAVIALIAILLIVEGLPGGGLSGPPPAGVAAPAEPGNPVPFNPARESAFAARAAAGNVEVLFTKSPGGVLATAARVAQYRGLIDQAVHGTNIPPALLEGLVFLESAGRSDAIAGNSVSDAVGLTQILAGTGQSLLGMKINLAQSQKLTKQINSASAAGRPKLAARLSAARARIDQRFDPAPELAATVRYLQLAERDLGGRIDLAITAYHSGIGNLQDVLHLYDSGAPVPYVQLYFDTAPDRHPAAWRLLSSLGDDSDLYYWRVLAAEQLMSMYRSNRAQLTREVALASSYPSNAQLLVPPGSVGSYATPAALSAAYKSGALVPLPRNAAALHLAYASSIGSLAKRVSAPAGLYRGLRPTALRMLVAIAAWVQHLSGARAPLIVANAVMDRRYDSVRGFPDDPPAWTGLTFQIERHYGSAAQAQAFQFVLDRLQSLNLISWIRGASTIEITVAPDAARVLAHGV